MLVKIAASALSPQIPPSADGRGAAEGVEEPAAARGGRALPPWPRTSRQRRGKRQGGPSAALHVHAPGSRAPAGVPAVRGRPGGAGAKCRARESAPQLALNCGALRNVRLGRRPPAGRTAASALSATGAGRRRPAGSGRTWPRPRRGRRRPAGPGRRCRRP